MDTSVIQRNRLTVLFLEEEAAGDTAAGCCCCCCCCCCSSALIGGGGGWSGGGGKQKLGMKELLFELEAACFRLEPELEEAECLGGRGVTRPSICWLLGLPSALVPPPEDLRESPPLLDVVRWDKKSCDDGSCWGRDMNVLPF